MVTRGGTQKRHTTALESGAPIQAIQEFWSNTDSNSILVACNGKLFRDDIDGDGPDNNLTGSLTLSTSADARFTFVPYDGKMYGSDGVNVPFYLASPTTAAVPITDLNPDAPGRASAMEVFKEQLFLGNFTDFDKTNTERPYGTIHSQPLRDNKLSFLAEEGARNDFNRAYPIRRLIRHGDDVLLIMQRNGMYWAQFSVSAGLGSSRTNFTYDELDSRTGLIAEYGATVTPLGTFIVYKDGVYIIASGMPPARPKYAGKPIETFWSGLNRTRKRFICAGEDIENNGVLMCVAHGASATNDKAIFLNYESWSAEGLEINDEHPAYSIYEGNAVQPFAFNCLGTIEDSDGKDRLIGGGYDGFLYTLEEGTDDDGQGYEASFTLPYLGHHSKQLSWHQMIIDADLEDVKNLTVTQRNYDRPIESSQVLQSGTAGTVLDEFELDIDFLSSDALGPIRGDMYGESRWTEISVNISSGLPLNVHGILVQYEDGEPW